MENYVYLKELKQLLNNNKDMRILKKKYKNYTGKTTTITTRTHKEKSYNIIVLILQFKENGYETGAFKIAEFEVDKKAIFSKVCISKDMAIEIAKLTEKLLTEFILLETH